MTREEQIIEAGKIAAEGKEFSVLVNRQHRTMSAYEIGFIEGAQWADSYPHWISVEDELPKEHFVDTSSKWVLVSIKGSVFIDSYNHKHKEWVNNGKCVDYWMPLPQPPRKED